jgi:hypothetical protein
MAETARFLPGKKKTFSDRPEVRKIFLTAGSVRKI